MIHNIASFLISQPSNPKHIKCFIPRILSSYSWQTAQYNLLYMHCSGIFSRTQCNQVILSYIFFSYFSHFLLQITLGCRVIITFSAAIVLMTYIMFSIRMLILLAFLSTQIDFNWPSPFLGGNLADVRLL